MKIIRTVTGLCQSCMEEHEILIVKVKETGFIQGQPIKYFADYHYCKYSNQFYETEDQISRNYTAMKQAYNKKRNI